MIKSQRKPPGVGTPTPVLCVEFEFRGTLANIKVELKKPNTQKANKQKAKAQCLKRKTLENCFTLFRFGLGFSARRAIYVLCIIPHTHIHLARRQIIRWTLKAECEMAGRIFFYFFFLATKGFVFWVSLQSVGSATLFHFAPFCIPISRRIDKLIKVLDSCSERVTRENMQIKFHKTMRRTNKRA